MAVLQHFHIFHHHTYTNNLKNLLLFFLHLVAGQAVLHPAFPPKLDSAVNLVSQGGTGMVVTVMVTVMAMVVIFFVMSNPNWSPSHERKQEDLV